MRNGARSVICLILVAVLLLTAIGCSSDELIASEPVTLMFAVDENTMPIERLVQEFEQEHPLITVEYHLTNGDNASSMESYVRAGNADIIRYSREALVWVDDGVFKPLDEIHLDEWNGIRDDYYGGLWEALALSGVQYGIPAGLDIYVAYVNTTEADARGVSLPSANWDRLDLIDFAAQMNDWDASGGSDSALIGFGTDPKGMDPLVSVYAHGGAIVDNIDTPRQAMLDDPLTIDGTQLYADLFTQYKIAPTSQQMRRLFPRAGVYEAQARGRCAVWYGWFSGRGGTSYYEWQHGWKMYHLPFDQVEMEMGNVEGYYLTSNCEHPQEALKFIRFLSDRWDAAGQVLPPRISLQKEDAYRDELGDDVALIVDSFSRDVVFLPSTYTPELEMVGGAYYVALDRIINQNLDAADVLTEAQRQVRTVFE